MKMKLKVACAKCPEEAEFDEVNGKLAQRAAREAGWRVVRKQGWTCGSCYGPSTPAPTEDTQPEAPAPEAPTPPETPKPKQKRKSGKKISD